MWNWLERVGICCDDQFYPGVLECMCHSGSLGRNAIMREQQPYRYVRQQRRNTRNPELNESDPPCSNPASTAVRTASRYSFSLHPLLPRELGEQHVPRVRDDIRQEQGVPPLINQIGGDECTNGVGAVVTTYSGQRVREETRSVCGRRMRSGRTTGGCVPAPARVGQLQGVAQ